MSKESAKSCRRLEERGGQLLGLFFLAVGDFFRGEIPGLQVALLFRLLGEEGLRVEAEKLLL